VGLAQQWDQLNQLGMRIRHNLEQQIQVLLSSEIYFVSLHAGLWIRIDLMRIRIPHFFLIANLDPYSDPDPVPDPGIDDEKFTA
jgi:hypothetical protein